MVSLGVLGTRAETHALHAAGLEDAVVAEAVGVFEVTRHDVGDPFDVAVRMHRPRGAGHERVVVENAERADAHIVRIVVPIEGEVPPRLEPAAVDPVDRRVRPELERRPRGHVDADGTSFRT